MKMSFHGAARCVTGSKHLLTLTEPAYTTPSEIYIDRVMYNYRSTGYDVEEKINESDPCEVNVNCSPVGDTWQEEKRGVARIYVVEGNQAGWCSGSLINNTAQDCKPYFLTALHCGVNATTANMNQWKFYFRYEAPTCINPTSVGTLASYLINGCLRIADSADGGGNSGSDFLLVKLGNANNENTVINNLKTANFNAYWNGWNANTSPTTGGVSIHHPAGDIKKISTFSGNTVSTQWGNATGSHWRVVWTANTNGHGVTEGGSSGSPLFDNTGNIIGTLTGGSSYCTALSAPDQYGKMSFHWTIFIAQSSVRRYEAENIGENCLNGLRICALYEVPSARTPTDMRNLSFKKARLNCEKAAYLCKLSVDSKSMTAGCPKMVSF